MRSIRLLVLFVVGLVIVVGCTTDSLTGPPSDGSADSQTTSVDGPANSATADDGNGGGDADDLGCKGGCD